MGRIDVAITTVKEVVAASLGISLSTNATRFCFPLKIYVAQPGIVNLHSPQLYPLILLEILRLLQVN